VLGLIVAVREDDHRFCMATRMVLVALTVGSLTWANAQS
jgi:hypothetical protein